METPYWCQKHLLLCFRARSEELINIKVNYYSDSFKDYCLLLLAHERKAQEAE